MKFKVNVERMYQRHLVFNCHEIYLEMDGGGELSIVRL